MMIYTLDSEEHEPLEAGGRLVLYMLKMGETVVVLRGPGSKQPFWSGGTGEV